MTFGEAYDARYYVSLASSNDCNDFIVHDIKYAFVTDDSFLRFNVPSSGTFYLIVSSMEEEGGFVNICVEQEEISACSTDDRLRVTNTSMGSLLSGPFQPQEVISFCYDLPAYQPGELSDCQWVQGIVPSFGMGWSDNSFDSLGMPIQSSIIQSVNENISWNWYDDVNVNVDNNNVFMSYNQRALLDLCHSTEVNCAGSPVVTGDLLPPGWFAHKTNEHPEDSGGDGLNCSNSQGPWQICFDLIATEEADLEISMFTFADGLIANDNFINDYCLNDLPECQTYFVECQSNPIDTSYNIITCNEVATVLFSEGSSRYFWTTPAVDNLENNFSGSGSSLEVNLTNLTDTIIQAEYFVKEFDETGCQLSEIHIIIDVYPSIEIPRPSTTTVCMNDSIQMDEIVDLDQYILGSFAVDWNSTNVDNNQNAFWNGTDDDTISYSVYSQATCTFQDTFIIDIENVIVEEFVTDQTLCAGEILDFHQALPLNEIVEDSFTVEWNLSGIPDDPFATTVINESTDISFEIIGERGCVYNDTFNVYVPSITLQSNMDNKLCSSDEILLNATISSDLISDFYWLTPKGISIALNNFVVPADNFDMGLNVFEFNVESIEGCLFSISDSVTLYQVPEVNVEGIVDTSGICSYEEITVNSVVSPEIYDITWFTPTGVLDTSNFTTSTQGDYFYITGYADNEISCLSIDSFYVEIYPDVETGFTYDELICVNDTTEIISEIPTYKFVWSTGSNGSTILATPGEYSVTVSNDFGCVQDYEFEISERALPAPLFSYDFSICEGDSTLIMPLDSQYNYEWNSGNTNNSEISFGGTHSVTVTDEIMCTDSFDFFVDVLVYPNVQLSYEINQDTLFLMNLTDDDFDCSYVLDDLVIPMANDTFLVLQEGDYTLSLQCANGDCSDAESVDFSIVVSGVEPQRISSLKLYPNPNNGDFNLSFEGGFLETIEIYSSEGRIVRKELVNQSNSYTYQSNLAQGVYWLKCTMDDQVVTKRIVVL